MIWAVVAGLALVQSWFGVGLLLLGTPLLLIQGLSFPAALWVLLPASLTVSGCQLWLDRRIDERSLRGIALAAVPALAVGMVISLVSPFKLELGVAIAAMLVVAVGLRISPALAGRVRLVARRHELAFLGLIGLVHGLTNMGGSLLLDYAASRHVDKYKMRQQVALGYVVFVVVQLAGLVLLTGWPGSVAPLGYAALAGAVFLLVGRRTFAAVSPNVFAGALNAFMLMVAGVLVWKQWR